MTTTRIFAATALACAAAVSLSACAGLGGGISLSGASPAAAITQINSQISAINSAAAQNCTGWGAVDWTPPLPPTGSLHAKCEFGPQMVPLSSVGTLLGQGGSFGGGGATTVVPPPAPPAPVTPK